MILKDIIEKKLRELDKPIEYTGAEWIRTTCLNPSHKDTKPSFHINTTSGYGACWSCSYKVNKEFWLEGIVLDNEEIEREIKLKELETKYLKKPELQQSKQLFLPRHDEDLPYNYRGLSKTIIEKLNIYICKTGFYKNRIIFPICYGDKLKAFETRALADVPNKYIHSKGFNSKELIYPYNMLEESGFTYIVLVEGIMDAISGWEVGVPTICNWGVADNFNIDKIKELLRLGITKIYISMDKDKAGAEATVKLLNNNELNTYFEVLPATQLETLNDYYKSKAKDLNDYLLQK